MHGRRIVQRRDRSAGGNEMGHQLRSAVHGEPAIQCFYIYVNRVLTQAQSGRDLFFAASGQQQPQRLPHARREVRQIWPRDIDVIFLTWQMCRLAKRESIRVVAEFRWR